MPNPKTRKPRGDAHYTREEILVINKYKEEYKEQTTRELRANIFKTKILVDLFNFWLEKGIGPKNEEESADRMKVGSLFWTQEICLLPSCSGTCGLGPKQLASLLNHPGSEGEDEG